VGYRDRRYRHERAFLHGAGLPHRDATLVVPIDFLRLPLIAVVGIAVSTASRSTPSFWRGCGDLRRHLLQHPAREPLTAVTCVDVLQPSFF